MRNFSEMSGFSVLTGGVISHPQNLSGLALRDQADTLLTKGRAQLCAQPETHPALARLLPRVRCLLGNATRQETCGTVATKRDPPRVPLVLPFSDARQNTHHRLSFRVSLALPLCIRGLSHQSLYRSHSKGCSFRSASRLASPLRFYRFRSCPLSDLGSLASIVLASLCVATGSFPCLWSLRLALARVSKRDCLSPTRTLGKFCLLLRGLVLTRPKCMKKPGKWCPYPGLP